MRLSHLLSLSLLATSLTQAAPVALIGNGTYTQDFNTLPATGTTPWVDDTTLPGWYAKKVALTTLNLVASDGASNAGNLYSFGVGTDTERALGSVSSGTPVTFTYGVQFQNTDTNSISINQISYNGEQWRNGGNTAANPLSFWYKVTADSQTDLSPGTGGDAGWTAATAGDFTTKVNTATAAALVGNDAANRTAITFNLGIAVPAGSFLMLRWKDINDVGNDHGVAIDDLSVAYASASSGAITLSLAPDNAPESAGLKASSGTVTLSAAAPGGGLVVNLSSNDTDNSELVLPPTVTVAGGATTATFDIGTKTDGIFDGNQALTLTAASTGYASGTATFTVTETDSSPSLVITELFDALGTNSTLPDINGNGLSGFDDAYLEITNSGGSPVDLSGMLIKSLGAGTTPAVRHTFPAGTTLAPGAFLLLFQDYSLTLPPHPAFTGFATLGDATSSLIFGDATDSVTLTTPSGAVISSFDYNGGTPGVALVRDANGSIVPHSVATGSGGLPYSPGRNTDGTASAAVTQSGFFLAATTATTILEKDDPASGYPNKVTFTAYRVSAGNTAPVTVTLSSSDTSNVSLPPDVTIPAGQNQATFDVFGVSDGAEDPASVKVGNVWLTPVTITGTLGAASSSGKINVVDAERLGLLVPTLFPVLSSIAEGDTVGTTLAVTIPAAEGVARDFTITATVNGAQVTLANGGKVTIPAGDTTASLGVVAVDDTDSDGPKTVTFVTSAAGYEPATTTLVVTDNDMFGYISLSGSGTYTQDFNTLPSAGSGTWTDDTTLSGWYAQRTGTGTNILVDTGAGNTGGLYSFGSAGSTDRALGSLGSSNAAAGSFAYGVQFKNNTSAPMPLNNVSYVGEQWRNAVTAAQTATLWYKIGTTATTTLTPNVDTGWTALTAGDFVSPVTTGTSGAMDGNAVGNKTAISFNPNLTLAAGEIIMFRWSDPDQTGSDHGLSIDDFSLAYSGGAPASPYAAWTSTVFGANASNPLIAGAGADPDGDGVPNLMEFALGTSPLAGNEARRVVSTKTATDYTLSYTAPTVTPGGVTYLLESATSPAGPWTMLTTGFTTSLVNNGNGTSTVTFSRPFTGTREFLRLKVAIP